MATKTVDGQEYGPEDFLVVEEADSPSTWHLQVKRRGTPDHRLMGAAWAALHGGYRGNKYEGPNKDEATQKLRALYKSEGMDTPDTADHSAPVIRKGPIFKLGAYPDKHFSLDEKEAAAAVASFTPVPIDSEHYESVFDGRLGRLSRVELRGDTIHGEMAVPKWLHELFDGTPIPVSTTWSRGPDKRIIGLALAKHPRVSEAAMLSALFAARHDTPEGQQIHQQIHDMTARSGAVCNRAEMHSAHERSGLQNIHDETVRHGAQCSGMNDNNDDGDMPARYAIRTKERPMDRKAFWKWLIGEADEPPGLEPADMTAAREHSRAVTPSSTPDPELAALKAEQERLRAELAQAKAARIASEAAAFADTQITAKKAVPAEREAIIAAYTQAAQDDASHGAVTFADGKTSSRIEQLTALFAARSAHQLIEEWVKDGTVALSLDRAPKDEASRREHLLSLTPLGRAAQDARKGNGRN